MSHDLWSARADRAQSSLEHFYGTKQPQYLTNWIPAYEGSNEIFNYWWLAHVIDARLDAFERTGDASWLEQAHKARSNLLQRNGGSLFNDYFDDMLWFALALERMGRLEGHDEFVAEAQAIWAHVIEFGWNDIEGTSLAWRKQQLYYKNTPANGPLIILSVRLHRSSGEQRYLDYARTAEQWLTRTLVDPETGFVEDGINREEDHRVDTQWRFTYNQGLYVGACVELAAATGEVGYLDRAERTAATAITELAHGGVFVVEGTGGDEGLFKGIYYRYLMTLLAQRPNDELAAFVRTSTDHLWANSMRDGWLFPGNDWANAAPASPLPYSTMLSAIMATEARAILD